MVIMPRGPVVVLPVILNVLITNIVITTVMTIFNILVIMEMIVFV